MGALTQKRLQYLFSYDPETGKFTALRKAMTRCPVRSARMGGTNKGYPYYGIDGAHYYAHRLAWLYVYGSFPDGGLDHINGDPTDNRIANLRIATPAQNQWNRGIQRNNTSGFKGVRKAGGRWKAAIRVNGRVHHLGGFATPEEAAAAYNKAARELCGEFARVA